jgi:uncharacterized protein (DUF1778 family)
MANANTTSVRSVRVSPAERAILEAAAEQAHMSLSDFMRRKALEATEVEVLNCTIVTIPAKDWEAFESLDRSSCRGHPGADGTGAPNPLLGGVTWWR